MSVPLVLVATAKTISYRTACIASAMKGKSQMKIRFNTSFGKWECMARDCGEMFISIGEASAHITEKHIPKSRSRKTKEKENKPLDNRSKWRKMVRQDIAKSKQEREKNGN